MSYPYDQSEQSVRRQMMSFFVPSETMGDWHAGSANQSNSSQPSASAERFQPFSTVDAVHRAERQVEFPFIKIQRKGSPQICLIPIHLVQTYENLLQCLQHIFHNPSFLMPEITTFEGDLISSSLSYSQLLRPGLHLIIYFPLSVSEDPLGPEQSVGEDTWDIARDESRSRLSAIGNALGAGAMTVNPSRIQITEIHDDLRHRIRKRSRREDKPLCFQPPSLSFYPSSSVPIAVTLSNSLIRGAAFCYVRTDTDEVTEEDSTSPRAFIPTLPWSSSPWTSSSSSEWPKELDKTTGFPVTEGGRPPWSPVEVVLSRSRPEGTFPLTTFDIYAQGSRRQIACSVNWDAVAHPSGEITLGDATEMKSDISWDLGDVLNPGISKRARSINWVNFAPKKWAPLEENTEGRSLEDDRRTYEYTKFTSTSLSSRKKCGKYWMLHPPRLLPAAFFPKQNQGKADDNIFYFSTPASQLPNFLNRVYTQLGFPNEKMREVRQYWEKMLPVVERRAQKGDLSKIFHMEIEPMPAELVRAFIVMWTLGPEDDIELSQVEVNDIRINRVVEIICSSGKAPRGVSLDGFKVFEWGGIVLPYSEKENIWESEDDSVTEGGSGSDTASDRTVRAASTGSGGEDVIMSDREDSGTPEDPDSPMGNDVDAVVLGEEGMYIVLRT
ncbi:hypothetical protein BDZ91DRAFT_780967 [Kalaharituber pfeilii]|nr:hypothetical protein BDZ91DRAFT_780967 [Kalaharituber pfeilii]